ncbi:MAG: RnfH family protein [Gammaproteobacteria bacterium CG_4_10_14_0_8_um_filter_38_16]|nr:MAG: RnfH family protein [Gammaproteobacteria bacterium CG_4_10_14_0_8_um_filter_38_16]PJA04160.1 MAG: RnfH family protein [Gammaproteobacteria bacterium CG_4_10_14_0_2_um_filter_38_22]PJB10101.1 MAG: RnfH family protein [Gammaproteobacteria bacterium CG_4_9_14_3_um_filter_38_9]
MLFITVAYATPERQAEIALEVDDHCTIEEAVALSGLVSQFPEINLSTMTVGIFGKTVSINMTLQTDDRIEIYRPLIIDPKEARRIKAMQTQ